MRDPTLDLPSELLIVRHGESAGNVAREEAERRGLDRIALEARRDCDVPLSPRGEQQAAALGRWLGELPAAARPTVVLSSPYLRASRTAALLLREGGLDGVGLRLDERLREREFGVLDRLTRRGIERALPEQAAQRRAVGKFYHRPPGGESWCDVLLRLRGVLETLSRDLRGERVVLVCHSVVVLCLRYLLEQLTEEQILAIDRSVEVANCSVTSYRRSGGALLLQRFNFVAPLRERGAPVTAESSDPADPAGRAETAGSGTAGGSQRSRAAETAGSGTAERSQGPQPAETADSENAENSQRPQPAEPARSETAESSQRPEPAHPQPAERKQPAEPPEPHVPIARS